MIRDSKDSYNAYMREYHLKRYHRMRKEAIDQLGGKCNQCGSLEDLQLDHIDPKAKRFEVSVFLSVKIAEFRKELEKCQVLCKGCHQIKSVLERGQILMGIHGKLNMYSHGKCRCQLCKDAWNKWSREYKREWKKRKKSLIS